MMERMNAARAILAVAALLIALLCVSCTKESRYGGGVWGGTWFGRWTFPGAAREGSSAVWASRLRGGPENGFSRELGSVYGVGHYRLGVWIIGDARGLVSLAVLGCREEDGGYRIAGSCSTEAPYGHAADVTWAGSWKEQTLDRDILEGDPAVGKPIGIRLAAATVPIPKPDSDAGRYGDSIGRDEVTPTYAAYAGLGERSRIRSP